KLKTASSHRGIIINTIISYIMLEEPKYIIVAGGSAGGMSALCELVAQLDAEIDAAVFIVLHLSKTGIGDMLRHRLQQFTTLPCSMAADGAAIKKGCIYIAPPNYHLVIKKSVIKIVYVPEEKRWRPTMYVLFRSAPVACG